MKTIEQRVVDVERRRARVRARSAEIARARGLQVERVAAPLLDMLDRDDPRLCDECCKPLPAAELQAGIHRSCAEAYFAWREARLQAMLAD